VNLTPEQLKETQEYQSLTDKQSAFIDHYIVSSDAAAATKAAYNCKDDRVAKAYSYRVLKMPAVVMTLAVFHQDNEAEIFAKMLWSKIVAGRLKEHDVEAFKLYAKVKGFVRQPIDSPEKPESRPEEPVKQQSLAKTLLDQFD
jgi:hypothetical protein